VRTAGGTAAKACCLLWKQTASSRERIAIYSRECLLSKPVVCSKSFDPLPISAFLKWTAVSHVTIDVCLQYYAVTYDREGNDAVGTQLAYYAATYGLDRVEKYHSA